ncbi:CH082 protein, partial [Piaya cayana]|nr:CH082 protein [Piaya cayana]
RLFFFFPPAFPQLFLDDTKVKNFITCFKDAAFLAFFFRQLERNRSGRYEAEFPFLSPCGGERNFLRCDDLPVVFTHLSGGPGKSRILSYGGAGDRLAVPFQPEKLAMGPANGRLYHPGPARAGGLGLVRSALAAELSAGFEYEDDAETAHPTHFRWEGRRYRLTGELLPLLRAGKPG